MAGFIVDTDVCIDFLRGLDYAGKLFHELLREELYISILSVYELLKGAYTEKQRKTIWELVDGLTTLLITKEIAERGASFYREYRKKGVTLTDVDCLIMATAREKGLLIVTRNVRHYPEVELLSEFSKGLLNGGV